MTLRKVKFKLSKNDQEDEGFFHCWSDSEYGGKVAVIEDMEGNIHEFVAPNLMTFTERPNNE